MQHSGKSSSRSSKKPPTIKELEKYVTDSRTLLEEHKADLKSIRYEIVNKLIEFTKFGQSLAAEKQNTSTGKSEREQRIEKLEIQLRQTAEDIEKKEALENDILEAYYATRTIYLKNHQRWRTMAFREILKLRSEGKTKDSAEMQPFTTKLLLKGDDNTSEFEKRTTTEWRGQMLSEKNVFFDIETGKLGQGAFGAVYKGRVFHSECAIKVLSSKHMTDTAKEEFKAEVITLSNLQHDRVLRFLGAVLDDKRMMLVTELCANGSMADRLFPPLAVKKSNNDDDDDDDDYEDRPRKPVAGKKKKTYYTLSPKKKLAIFRGIIEGMIFLHEHKIVHYDLKPENILLDEEFNPVIADFGLARILNIEDVLGMSSGMGTPFYMAPEMLTTPVQLSPKCDVYAFGFIAWELWTQERNEWKDCVTGGGVNTSTLHGIIKSGKRPSFDRPDKPFPETMRNIISKCWDFDPNKRPDFKYLQFIIKNNPDVLEKAIRWTALKDNLRDSAGSGRKTQEMMELERVLINLSNDAFFAIYEEIIGSEVSKNAKAWDQIVRKIEGIKDGEKCNSDAISILWEKFVVEYPKVLGIPEFKAEEQILFRIFMIQEDATNQSAVVTKRDYDLYVKFFNPKPDFTFFQELLNIPYYFGRYDNKDKMAAAFQNDSFCFFIRQSSNISSYVISFKCGPGTGVLSCPLADMSSMDSLSLLRFFKDKNSVLKKITAVAPEKAGKNQWHEVKPVYRPDSLTFAVAELKEIKEMRNKLKKKGKADSDVKTKSHNVGMYVFGISNDDEDDEGVNTTYAKNELDSKAW